MEFHQPPRQRQTETRSAVFPAQPTINLTEWLQHHGNVLRRDSDSRISDGDADGIAILPNAYLHRAAFGRELHRIGQQIEQHLADSTPISKELRHRLATRSVDDHPRAHRLALDHAEGA